MYLKKLSLIFLSNVWSSSLINRRKKWLECKNPLNMVKQVKLFVNKLSATLDQFHGDSKKISTILVFDNEKLIVILGQNCLELFCMFNFV